MSRVVDIWGAGMASKLLNSAEYRPNQFKIETGSMVILLRHCTVRGERSGGAVVRIQGKGTKYGHAPGFPVHQKMLKTGWTRDHLSRHLTEMRHAMETSKRLWGRRSELCLHLEKLVMPDPLPLDGHSDIYTDMVDSDIDHWWNVSKTWEVKHP